MIKKKIYIYKQRSKLDSNKSLLWFKMYNSTWKMIVIEAFHAGSADTEVIPNTFKM